MPTLVLHGDADQIVPIADSALLSATILRHATLKVIRGAPHGMCTTHADRINAELLAFLNAKSIRPRPRPRYLRLAGRDRSFLGKEDPCVLPAPDIFRSVARVLLR